VSVQWRVYGTCGHQTRCPGLLFENYRYRADDNYIGSHLTKTICNPRLVTDISNPHYVHYIKDYFTVSENGSVVPHAFFFDASYGKLRINHYQSKSCEELIEKNHRGWPDGTPQLDEDFLYRFSVQCSKVYDPIMNRYIDELKKRISSN
jgi:hypothetical protein